MWLHGRWSLCSNVPTLESAAGYCDSGGRAVFLGLPAQLSLVVEGTAWSCPSGPGSDTAGLHPGGTAPAGPAKWMLTRGGSRLGTPTLLMDSDPSGRWISIPS